MLRAVLLLTLLLCLAGCAAASAPASDATQNDAPALLVSPTSFATTPLPHADAERVFRWPTSGVPSLIFVYDDGEG
ncbi:MAG: hypothetical protein U0822_00270 [Anaerolineae bacterium]